jgi:hypothetical protein
VGVIEQCNSWQLTGSADSNLSSRLTDQTVAAALEVEPCTIFSYFFSVTASWRSRAGRCIFLDSESGMRSRFRDVEFATF